jgi:hypothetical protein
LSYIHTFFAALLALAFAATHADGAFQIRDPDGRLLADLGELLLAARIVTADGAALQKTGPVRPAPASGHAVAEIAFEEGRRVSANLVFAPGCADVVIHFVARDEGDVLERLSLELPLRNFSPRKRVRQFAENSLVWDTRAVYQFHTTEEARELLYAPDTNRWTIFRSDYDHAGAGVYALVRQETETAAPLVLHHGSNAPRQIAVWDRKGGLLAGFSETGNTDGAPSPASPCALEARVNDAAHGDRIFWDLHPASAAPLRGQKQTLVVRARITLAPFSGKPAPPAPPALPAPSANSSGRGPGEASPLLPVFGGVPLARGVLRADETAALALRPSRLLQTAPLAFWPDGSIKWIEVVFASGAGVPPAGRGVACDARARDLMPRPANAGFASEAPTSGAGVPPAPVASLQGSERPLARFEVTHTTGRRERFVLEKTAHTPASASGSARLFAEQNRDEIRVATGRLDAVFTIGKNWWPELRSDGKVLWGNDASAATGTAFTAAVSAYTECITLADGDSPPEPGAHALRSGIRSMDVFVAEKITLEERGPVRAVVCVDGRTGGPAACPVRLRFEFYAGSPAVRGWHTFEVGDFDPRRVFITALGIGFSTRLSAAATRVAFPFASGKMTGAATLAASSPVTLLAAHPDALLLSSGASPARSFPGVGGAGALRADDGTLAIFAGLRDMTKLFPAALSFSAGNAQRGGGEREGEGGSGGATLDFQFWPRDAVPMDLRRYSDFPHAAQGETITGRDNAWVREKYYREEPVRGISRTHEFLFVACAASMGIGPDSRDADAAAVALAAALEDRPLIWSGEKEYATAGVLDVDLGVDSGAGEFAPVRETLERFFDFIAFHQKRYRWFGKWVYGDIQHSFMRDYGRVVKPQILADLLASGKTEITKADTVRDYARQNDWASDNGRWGWTNTEGLPNRYLSELYLRTGRRDVFFAMEALARQSRDVVMRHSGRWFGSGTRHGVQPWSDGGHQQRQIIPSEYRLHRLLTGDRRSRDVLLNHGYHVFLKPVSTHLGPGGVIYYHADHSGRLYGLLALWEATGDAAAGEALARYVSQFVTPGGIAISPAVRFPQVERAAPPGGLNSGSMFFNCFGGMHALVEFYGLTRDESLRLALCRMAAATLDNPEVRGVLESGRLDSRNFQWLVLAFAARHADQPGRYREFLHRWANGPGVQAVHQMVTRNRAHWTGPAAFVHANLPETLFWLNVLPAVAQAAAPLIPLSAECNRIPDSIGKTGRKRAIMEGSWQDEYDRPEFNDWPGPGRRQGRAPLRQ